MSQDEKRRDARQEIDTEALIVEMRDPGTGVSYPGRTRNLSTGGCFIETQMPPPVGAEVQLFIGSAVATAALRATARVRRSDPGHGCGVEFTDHDEDSRADVETFIDRFCPKP